MRLCSSDILTPSSKRRPRRDSTAWQLVENQINGGQCPCSPLPRGGAGGYDERNAFWSFRRPSGNALDGLVGLGDPLPEHTRHRVSGHTPKALPAKLKSEYRINQRKAQDGLVLPHFETFLQ
jgi:hypothetical protein